MDIIQSLWIGDELSIMEQLSIKSFLYHGHEYHLYTYGSIKNIPDGTTIKDANEIVPENKIFRYKNGSVSAFSNYFRFKLLYLKGGYWADTDLICVRPIKIDQLYVISSEPIDKNYNEKTINAGLLKFPKESQSALHGFALQKLIKKKIKSGEIEWQGGPLIVKKIVELYDLEKYVLPWVGISSCGWFDAVSIVDEKYKCNPKVIKNLDNIPENMYGIHLWNEVWRRKGLDKNKNYNPNSLYELLKKKYLY